MPLDELCTLLARHARDDGATAIQDLLVGREVSILPPPPSMAGTRMTLIAQGAKRLAYGEQVYDHRAGHYLVASTAVPLKCRFLEATPERPVLGLCLLLQPSQVAELLLQAGRGAFADDTIAPPAVGFAEASKELLDAAMRLVRLLDQPRDRDVLTPLIKREILWRLLTSEHGAIVRQIGLTDPRLSPIAEALQWIRENYREPFQVPDLARLTGMSTSAFHRHFQAVTRTTPIQYQKQIRLNQARLLLAANPRDVANIGYLVGYDSPSQFSREYRRLFGAPPSQDAITFTTRVTDENRTG
ncbi:MULTISPECIES: AraC family transcriptional regulator [Nocardia]|uniref:AraC family transcriptional regulator n=1 Tax=Nocardia sputorum TaxID=2984338 RepID=A0ABM8CX88_9NOCA|nr:AraC family transcriptional regulator [Nocardia sputorum]BDT90987.1 AraC family transcriptional regulator [Nocardia sputorum]BDT99619.1 AraC family transcriptional regulator [Nocardia sputorum]